MEGEVVIGTKKLRGVFSIADSLLKVVSDIADLGGPRGPLKGPYSDMVRRVKLLTPFFEELKDRVAIGEEEANAMVSLEAALVSTQQLLRSIDEGSKIYQVIKNETFTNKFLEVTALLEKALSDISYDKLAISLEVREQVELIQAQFKRAAGRFGSPDVELARDLSRAHNEKTKDPAILKRLSEKLDLRTFEDFDKERIVLDELAKESQVSVEDLLAILQKIRDCVVTGNPNVDSLKNIMSPSKIRSPIIPDDFRCQISLELMKDPVIVSTGQTYERSSIQKWLNAGHKTCPKSQQHLSHTSLTPNYVLKSVIAQWCESNGLQLPKQQGDCQDKKSTDCSSDCDQADINLLLQKLKRGSIEDQRAAAGHLRLLAKRNADNRVCIADAGAIPLLIEHLSSIDPRTQEHAVTALLNLSINEKNKNLIVEGGAIPVIVEVLKGGSMEARENAAAALFSLSVIETNKGLIGEAGAIPVLIDLLRQGSPRGKKDAATALFNLSILPENKQRAVKAGIVVHLMKVLMDPSGGMVDEALAIMAVLANSQEGKQAIGRSQPIPVLVALMRTGSPRNRENSAAVLSALCTDDAEKVMIAKECGVEEALKELSECGTDRAKRKAATLLEVLRQNAEA